MFSLVFGLFALNAQQNFLPAYVVNNNGDTIYGEIDYRNWRLNPKSVVFQAEKMTDAVYYTPEQIQAFSVADEIYVSALMEIDKAAHQTAHLSYSPEAVLVRDTLFLMARVLGEKRLYYLADENGKEHFFIPDGTGGYTELIYRAYFKTGKSQRTIRKIETYKGQLSVYLEDMPELKSKIYSTNYGLVSMDKLFSKYYQLKNQSPEYIVKKEKLMAQGTILAGVVATQLQFHSSEFQGLVNADYGTHTGITAGMALNLVFPRTRGKWSLYNELLYSQYKMSEDAQVFVSANKWSKVHTQLEFAYLQLHTLIRYQHPVKNTYVFFNFGLANSIKVAEENYKFTESHNYSIVSEDEGKAMESTRSHERGLVFGVGVKYKQFGLELRGERGDGMSDYNNLNSTTNRLYALLSFTF